LQCGPHDQIIYESKITQLETDLTQQKAVAQEMLEKVGKLVDENAELKESERQNQLAIELETNARLSSDRQLQTKASELRQAHQLIQKGH
jgi:hypothetical protein